MKMKVRILLPEQEFQILDKLIDEVVGSDKDSRTCAFSSAEEQSLDVGKVGGSIPSRRTGAVWSASFGVQDGPHQFHERLEGQPEQNRALRRTLVICAPSSAEEQLFHTEKVEGPIPSGRTKQETEPSSSKDGSAPKNLQAAAKISTK